MTLTILKGRMRITITAEWLGNDLAILIYGGKAHIGAVALASPTRMLMLKSLPGHKESELAQNIAQGLAKRLRCTVCVCTGIHYDSIHKSEIEDIEKIAASFCRRFHSIYI